MRIGKLPGFSFFLSDLSRNEKFYSVFWFWDSRVRRYYNISKQGDIWFFLCYFIQHCFICRPSDSTVPTDAGIAPRTVARIAFAARRSNHQARSHPYQARSHPYQAKSHPSHNKYCRSHTNEKKEGQKILPQQTSLVSALCKKEREKDSKMSLNTDVLHAF